MKGEEMTGRVGRMDSMGDLAEFLLARFVEDEATARELQRRAQDVQLTLRDPNALGRWIPGWHDWPDVEALTARVLAKCKADRLIVERYQHAVDSFGAYPNAGNGMAMGAMTDTLRLLALPYADHPDCREEWKP